MSSASLDQTVQRVRGPLIVPALVDTTVFVLAGVEKMTIVPGFTAYNPYDLISMPYSHGLVAALGWSVLVALVVRVLRRPAAGPRRVRASRGRVSRRNLSTTMRQPSFEFSESPRRLATPALVG